MTKPTYVLRMVVLAAAVLAMAGVVWAQSLGDVAREQRAKRAAQAPQKPRVFTNDNLPREGGLSTTAVEPPKKDAKDKDKDKDKEAEDPAKKRAEEEREYRARAAKLREALAYEEKKLDVLQRELNLAQVQHYSDPNEALRQQNTRSDINQKQAELEKQKQTIEAAKKAISDLEDELRRRNLPQGWAR
jgi:hypothetical protein